MRRLWNSEVLYERGQKVTEAVQSGVLVTY